ncbi:MAG: M56 family metallopeptidase [Thermoguttaceae bacterium]
MSEHIFHFLWTNSWQSLLMTGFALIIAAILGNRLQPRFRYLIWCLILFRLALPVLPSTPWGIWPDQLTQNMQVDTTNSDTTRSDDIESDTTQNNQTVFEDAGIYPELGSQSQVTDFVEFTPTTWTHADPFEPTETSFTQIENITEPIDVASEPVVLELAEPISGVKQFEQYFYANWKFILLSIWLPGLLFLGLRYLLDELRLYRQSRYWKPITDPKILGLFRQAYKEIGVRLPVSLLAVSNGIGAASTGFLRPKILLSEKAVRNMDDAAIKMVLMHELIHIKRFDPIVLRIATILSLIYWPNPVSWFLVSRLQRDRELACDAAVLHKLDSKFDTNNLTRMTPKEYGQTVLAFAALFTTEQRLPGLVGAFQKDMQKNSISRRIDMIMKYKKPRFLPTFCGFMLVLILAVVGLTQASPKTEQPSQPVKPTTARQQMPDAIDTSDTAVQVKNETDKPIAATDVEQTENTQNSINNNGGQPIKVSGIVLDPDGNPLGGIFVQATTFYEGGGFGSSTGPLYNDGKFEVTLLPKKLFMLGVFDTKGRFAASPRVISSENLSEGEEIIINMEEGTPVELRYIDEKTNKPIPGIKIVVAQKHDVPNPVYPAQKDYLSFDLTTDENGQVKANLMPGEYAYSNFYKYITPDGLYTKEFIVEKGKPLSFETSIPIPFIGKVIFSDGTPAADCFVFSANTVTGDSSQGQSLLAVRTDENGVFRSVEPLKDRCLEFKSGNESSVIWIKDELANLEEYTFQLVKKVPVSGRLIDSQTKEPLGNQNLLFIGMNPANLTQETYMPDSIKTLEDGTFNIKLNPTLEYVLLYEPSNGSARKRISRVELTPDTPLNLGDLVVDPKEDGIPVKAKQIETPPQRNPNGNTENNKLEKVSGIVLDPDGNPLGDVLVLFAGRTKEGGGFSHSYPTNVNGRFPFLMPLEMPIMLGIYDKQGRFAASPRVISRENLSDNEEIIINMEVGTPLELRYFDEKTNKPIPGLMISIDQKYDIPNPIQDIPLAFNLTTDDNGKIKANLVPGKYAYRICNRFYNPDDAKKGLYDKEFTIEKDKLVSFEVGIPKPFTGKVVLSDGSPAGNCSAYTYLVNSFWSFRTNQNGLFSSVEPPKDCNLKFEQENESCVIWIKDELASLEEYTFQMVKKVPVSGRLIDSKTKKPLANQILLFTGKNPANPEQKMIIPYTIQTQKNGTFTVLLNPTMKYDMSAVISKTERDGGRTMYPRVELDEIELTPDTPLNLGDLVVDLDKAIQNPNDKYNVTLISNSGPNPITEDDVIVFQDGAWKNEKTGLALEKETVLLNQEDDIALQFKVDGSTGKVVSFLNHEHLASGKFIRVSDSGNTITISGNTKLVVPAKSSL